MTEACGVVKKEGDTCLDSQVSQVNPGAQWNGCKWLDGCNIFFFFFDVAGNIFHSHYINNNDEDFKVKSITYISI